MQAPLQARNDSDAVQTDTARTVAQRRVLVDNRPEAIAQRKLAEMMNDSPRVSQERALSDAIYNSPRMVAQRHQMNTLFGGTVSPRGEGAMPAEASSAQREEEEINNTGLPNQLKSGIESLSGMSMDHVKVHYNSEKPAQLQAHAYAQGSEIYLGAGQERHLPHEAWHVVQQAQGRVRPTLQMKAGAVNDDPSLESEADMMGERAAQFKVDHARKLVAEERSAGAVARSAVDFQKIHTTDTAIQRVLIRKQGGADSEYVDDDCPALTLIKISDNYYKIKGGETNLYYFTGDGWSLDDEGINTVSLSAYADPSAAKEGLSNNNGSSYWFVSAKHTADFLPIVAAYNLYCETCERLGENYEVFNRSKVNAVCKEIKDETPVYPIEIDQDFNLANGRHRILASIFENLKTVPYNLVNTTTGL
jgi:hypothetical protein